MTLLGLAAGAFAAETISGAVAEPGPPPWPLDQPQQQIGGATVQGKIGRMSIGEAEAFLAGGLVGLNRYQLRVMGVPPISRALHEGRVVYDRRDPEEHWRSIREIWEAGDGISGPRGIGRGDCEDLAAAVAAERCEAGQPSELAIVPVRRGLSHALVRDQRTRELMDPSRTGGMGWEREHRAKFGGR